MGPEVCNRRGRGSPASPPGWAGNRFDILVAMNDRDSYRAAHAAPWWVLPSAGSCWDKFASDAASTSVEGLRQPGGDQATFNQDVPGGVQIPIVGDATLRAGPGPDRKGFLG
jgi:hypothetical protein